MPILHSSPRMQRQCCLLCFYADRYHKSQAIYLESKDNTKISCVISSVGTNEIWVRKTSDSTKMRIYLGQLQRGAFVIRRRSAAWNISRPLTIQPQLLNYPSNHPAALLAPVWCIQVEFDMWPLVPHKQKPKYSSLWPRVSHHLLFFLHTQNASTVIYKADCFSALFVTMWHVCEGS